MGFIYTRWKVMYRSSENELNMFPEEEVMLVDCGGTRSQRRKWPYVISEVFYGTYFFFISLTDFFQVLMEDGLTSRIHDTLHLFEAVQQRVNANHNPIVVILSKLDLFVGCLKLKFYEFSRIINYQGPNHWFNCIQAFISWFRNRFNFTGIIFPMNIHSPEMFRGFLKCWESNYFPDDAWYTCTWLTDQNKFIFFLGIFDPSSHLFLLPREIICLILLCDVYHVDPPPFFTRIQSSL
eukprot:TRINITY_DN4936_c0_g1_i12.p1 TRINITY_DN4936_c0_g1~~TRINITY_DN4936_c0_g1_i12.p1  ORF type:complete len:237 (-),score=27.15 TRINITY_DN4936_c0_g1_i12:119-829(-)